MASSGAANYDDAKTKSLALQNQVTSSATGLSQTFTGLSSLARLTNDQTQKDAANAVARQKSEYLSFYVDGSQSSETAPWLYSDGNQIGTATTTVTSPTMTATRETFNNWAEGVGVNPLNVTFTPDTTTLINQDFSNPGWYWDNFRSNWGDQGAGAIINKDNYLYTPLTLAATKFTQISFDLVTIDFWDNDELYISYRRSDDDAWKTFQNNYYKARGASNSDQTDGNIRLVIQQTGFGDHGGSGDWEHLMHATLTLPSGYDRFQVKISNGLDR